MRMADTMLGILITKHENLGHIAGVVRAARKAGHQVRIFVTDEGVKFTRDPQFIDLLKDGGIEIAVCDHMCEILGIGERAAGITYGSQYDNAGMMHECTRVLVF
jgi:hypothetical protein